MVIYISKQTGISLTELDQMDTKRFFIVMLNFEDSINGRR